MGFPSPTPKQARVLWLAATTLATGVLVAMFGAILLGLGWLVNRLSSVLLPLAVAAILAYLLDPIVDFIERRRIARTRTRAIWLVFLLGFAISMALFSMVVPKLVVELINLVDQIPEFAKRIQASLDHLLTGSPLGARARRAWESRFRETVQTWLASGLPVVSTWLLTQATRVVSWAGLLTGLALVPVYVFYFLLEKSGITRHWTDYLPIQESKTKSELVFVLESINNYLIVFFRGQVLVAICDGILLTVCFIAMGLDYGLLLGILAGCLSIVPFLGVALSLIPSVALAAIQFGDWLHPLLVLGSFALVQTLEGLFISPKIIGDRVGLHPLTIIVAVMIGTTLMGGILGGILAIPLTAALRVLMFRYIWRPKAAR